MTGFYFRYSRVFNVKYFTEALFVWVTCTSAKVDFNKIPLT